MKNLLIETQNEVNLMKKKSEDIVFIGSLKSGYRCSWSEFEVLADKEYDDGFGAQKVAYDLIIVFKDGSYLKREEYDGSEWWESSCEIKIPNETKKIITLFTQNVGWESLEEINESEG